ncbi:phosphotransferase [Pseudomonas aeruginosa]|nr:phosphotransferase [Pseudomonas aeruginosa]
MLRSDALSALPASLDREQEFAVPQVVHQAGVKSTAPAVAVPRYARAWAGVLPDGVRAGCRRRSLAQRRRRHPGPGAAGGAAGANLARLHQVRPPCAALDFLPMPTRSPALATIDAYRRYLDTLADAYPVLEWGLRWCELHAPHNGTLCLLHRDYRTGNYLASEQGLEAVLDWEFTGWGDPCEDLGWFTARCWRFTRPDLEAGGIGQLEDFLGGYHEVSPLRIERSQLHYWQVMATLRWAVIALQQGQRHLSGEEPSIELALTARLLPELELDILHMTGAERHDPARCP